MFLNGFQANSCLAKQFLVRQLSARLSTRRNRALCQTALCQTATKPLSLSTFTSTFTSPFDLPLFLIIVELVCFRSTYLLQFGADTPPLSKLEAARMIEWVGFSTICNFKKPFERNSLFGHCGQRWLPSSLVAYKFQTLQSLNFQLDRFKFSKFRWNSLPNESEKIVMILFSICYPLPKRGTCQIRSTSVFDFVWTSWALSL